MKRDKTESHNPEWLSICLALFAGIALFVIGSIFTIEKLSKYIEQKGLNFSFHLLDGIVFFLFFVLCSIWAKFAFHLFRKKINKIIVYIISLPLLLVTIVSGFIFLLFIETIDDANTGSEGLCGENIIDEISSPGDNLKAVIFSRDCGAATDFNTHIVIIPNKSSLSNLPLRKRPSVFSADCNHGKAPSGRGGGPEVKLSWISNSRIEIQYHKLARVHLQRSMSKGVSVQYKDVE